MCKYNQELFGLFASVVSYERIHRNHFHFDENSFNLCETTRMKLLSVWISFAQCSIIVFALLLELNVTFSLSSCLSLFGSFDCTRTLRYSPRTTNFYEFYLKRKTEFYGNTAADSLATYFPFLCIRICLFRCYWRNDID